MNTDTEASLFFRKGSDLFDAGRFEEALNCFDEALKLDPNHLDAYLNKV